MNCKKLFREPKNTSVQLSYSCAAAQHFYYAQYLEKIKKTISFLSLPIISVETSRCDLPWIAGGERRHLKKNNLIANATVIQWHTIVQTLENKVEKLG